jgi:O-antigen/teichoic acid export membrane protein
MVVSDFGLNDLIVRDVARDHTLAPQYFVSSLISKTIFSCLSIAFLIPLVYLMGYSEEIILYTIVSSVSILLITLMNSITSILKALERMEHVLLITVISSAALLVFVLTIVYLKGSLLQIFSFRVLALFVGLMIGFIIFVKNIIKPGFSIDLPFIKRLLANAFPFLTNGIIYTLYLNTDIILLSKIKGELHVGWYTAAAGGLFWGLLIIPASISTITYPIFSRQYKEGIDQLRNSCNFTMKILIILGVPISVGVFILAPQIIHSIFGSRYENSITVLQILAIAISFMFARDPLGFGLAAIGKVKALMWLNISFLVLNIILNLILIPVYAEVGAAITSAICIFLSLPAGYYILKREINDLRIVKNYFKPIIAALVMGFIIYSFRDYNLIAIIFTGAIIYSFIIFILKTFNHSELLLLKRLFHKG